jgi:hypothetical protein
MTRTFPPVARRSSRPARYVPAVLVGALATVAAYLLVAGVLLPGLADVVAALPDVVRYGFLLVVTSGTRLVGGWFAVRRLRRDHGLRRRQEGIAPAAAAGFVAWLNVGALASVLGMASGTTEWMAQWMSWLLAVELLRWPAEAVLGGLMAFPGPPDSRTGR